MGFHLVNEMKFPAVREKLPTILDWAEGLLGSLRKEIVLQLRMALEEALVNVMDYSGSAEVEVQISCTKTEVQIIVQDWGRPFDPRQQRKPREEESCLEAIAPGGLGIHLIEHLVDRVDYERGADYNRLILTKCVG
jgi:serine/threonine-protein kinase RsbW